MIFLKVFHRAALDMDVDCVESDLKYSTSFLDCFRIFFTHPDIVLFITILCYFA